MRWPPPGWRRGGGPTAGPVPLRRGATRRQGPTSRRSPPGHDDECACSAGLRRGDSPDDGFEGRSVPRLTPILLALLLAATAARAQQPATRTRNVVLIVADGVRWQEVFRGAEAALVQESQGVEDTTRLRSEFVRPGPADARRALMPFLWDSIARLGQVIGDSARGSDAHVTNGLKFSYPGYNEMLTGAPDPRIDRNDYGPNPNSTVFQWLNGQPGFSGKVAAYGTWGVFRSIFARERSGLWVRAGWEPPFPSP